MLENDEFRLLINQLPEIRSSRSMFERLLEQHVHRGGSPSRSSRSMFERLLERCKRGVLPAPGSSRSMFERLLELVQLRSVAVVQIEPLDV